MRASSPYLPSLAAATLGALLLPAAGTHAQTQPQPQPPPCSAADAKAGTCTPPAPGSPTPAAPAPTAGQKFPYPGSDADADDPITPAAPNTPTAPAAKPGQKFPYPGDPAPPDSSSSSSSSSSSAADPDDPDADTPPAAATPPAGRRKLPRPARIQSDDERFAEDVKVAKFYHDDGNNLAAYNRLRDATKLVTDDPDAWFLLGDVAAKLKKPDESLTAYRKFLALEPNSRRAKNLQHDQPELRAAR